MHAHLSVAKPHQATAAADEPPVDLVHLARHTLGNRDLEQEVLTLYQRQSACYVRRLKIADTTEEQCAAAHIIKGSSRGIGAWRVARLAEAVEAAYNDGQIDADVLADQLVAAISEANSFIKQVLSKKTSSAA